MGNKTIKHPNLSHAIETCSSPEFELKRRLHDRSEYTLTKIGQEMVETEEEISIECHGIKRTTFLEPPIIHDEVSKEIFRQSSLVSERGEFTYAKEKLKRKKVKSHIDKSVNLDDRAKKSKRKKRKAKRNKSHERVKVECDESRVL